MQDIKLYTTPFCPYCVQAKRLLKEKNYDFSEIDLSKDPETRARLSEENDGYRTVPMIFIGDKFVGGFQELAALSSKGELEKIVRG